MGSPGHIFQLMELIAKGCIHKGDEREDLKVLATGVAAALATRKGSLLKQLAIANKSLGGGVVVVLAERDKEEMEMDIAKLEFSCMGTSVIYRSGSPLILADLKKEKGEKKGNRDGITVIEAPCQLDLRIELIRKLRTQVVVTWIAQFEAVTSSTFEHLIRVTREIGFVGPYVSGNK